MIPTLALRYALLASLIANALFVPVVIFMAGQRDRARADTATLHADLAEQRAAFEARARQQEREQHQALAGIREIFDREMTDAQTQHDDVVAALRAGTLQLRQHWQARLATAELSAVAAAAARVDGDAELRAAGAGDLVRGAAECDARITALQGYARVCSGANP